ncbi:MAG: hypothetical protein KGL16_09785, partial [Acidobacteriota bacterium]|nr:hypothetical protein [Acidobacteriota bacterium]
RIPTHGGSIRVFSARKGTHCVDASVGQALAAEAAAGLDDGSGLKTFRDRVIRSKVELFELLAPLKRAGARMYGIGAPSRASTLINYTGLDDGILDCVLEGVGHFPRAAPRPALRVTKPRKFGLSDA